MVLKKTGTDVQLRHIMVKEFNVYRICIVVLIVAASCFRGFSQARAGTETVADSLDFKQEINAYILKDISTSRVVLSKKPWVRVQPASLTKILTAIIAIESGKLGDVVVISDKATQVEPAKAGLESGDKIRLVDLVKAAMVRSSNDAAFAIAIHLGGSIRGFARMMNVHAKKIGMDHSHFTNPAGYDRDIYAGHYSTAGDLMKLTEYAIGNEIFNRIAALDSVSFYERDTKKKYSLKSSNKLLETYPPAVGIKTGYTLKAGRCLIARARKGEADLVLVMLKAGKKRWELAEKMFEQAFGDNQRERVSYRPERALYSRPLLLKGNELQ